MPSLATYMTATDARPLGRALRRRGRRNPGTGAVINAIVDALSELGVHHIEIPAIPERVRCAIQDAPRFQAIEARHLGVQIDAYDQCQAGRVCPPRGMATAIGAGRRQKRGLPRNVPCYFPANAQAGKNFSLPGIAGKGRDGCISL